MKTLWECSLGNSKYKHKKTQKQRVMIANMQAAKDCIGKLLGFCQIPEGKKCYADRDETMYKQCLPYRRRQEKQWNAFSGRDIANSFLAMNARLRKKVTHFRFNEAGEMRDIRDFLKACYIARKLHKKANIQSFIYTTRQDFITRELLDFAELCHLTVNGSGWKAHNEYRVVEKGYKPATKREFYCRSNCHICRACKECRDLTILTECRG